MLHCAPFLQWIALPLSPHASEWPERDAFAAQHRLLEGLDRADELLSAPGASADVASAGLPVPEVTCAVRLPGGKEWIGASRGLCSREGDTVRYYAGRRWLPDDVVRAIWAEQRPDGSERVLVRTAGGDALIASVPITLREKAEFSQRRLEARHLRDGFVCENHLDSPGEVLRYTPYASDNDGLWSAMAAAAMTFRAAVLQTEEAWALARQIIDALIFLEQVTPLPGFPARAVVRKGSDAIKSGGEWHDSEDGQWEWKGDTSSDELDGHFFAFCIYHDLAPDEAEKAKVAAAAARIADHLIAHDYVLEDMDGKHTTWAVFGPQFLNDDPNWKEEQGLNSLELLSYLRVTHHMTGEAKYQEHSERLVRDHHYAENTIDQKILPPRGHINHSDDELAFLAYYGLPRHESDPELRAMYVESIRRSWEIERPERCPLWDFIYSAVTGEPGDTEASVATLQDISLDCCNWRMENGHRADVETGGDRGRFGEAESREPLPPGERAMMKWNGNPYRLDGGGDGRSEDDGAFWLLPYWLGRYHGLFDE